ncbi:MAG: substrate-binding domain-containing protein [Clostridia bacterium]|nr:substrate-binding domain-containing protein [Clostridia bacterium]
MKKVITIILTILVALAIGFGCYKFYDYEINKEVEINDEKLFDKENYPKVDASLAIHPLVNSIAANFMQVDESELDYEYTTGRSSEVYHNVIDGNVDVIFAAEISEEDKQYAEEKGVELEIIPATSSAFVFIVNKENPVEELTLEQIQDIYAGKITNWKEVGGDDEEIIAYQRPTGSGSQTAMLSLVMKDKTLKEPVVDEIEQEMGGLVKAVAEYENAKGAIGYSYFYYINTMYNHENVKMIKVDGVMPSINSIKNNEYPIYTNGFIVYRKNDVSENLQKWLDNLFSERGDRIIEEAGYVPCK